MRGFLVNKLCGKFWSACHMYVISSLEITKDMCASFPAPKIVPANPLVIYKSTWGHYCGHIWTRCPNESSLPPTFENEAAYLGYLGWKGEMIQSFPTIAWGAPMTNPATDLQIYRSDTEEKSETRWKYANTNAICEKIETTWRQQLKVFPSGISRTPLTIFRDNRLKR